MSGGKPALSTILSTLMRERNVSLDQLERASGVSRSTIYRWRQGRVGRAYTLGNLLKVARALDLDRITTSRLLQAAGQVPLDRLEATIVEDEIQQLLAHWTPAATTNLPAELTSFIGRDEDLIAVADLLNRQGARLVTLSGPGGSGKTRMARRVARELLDTFREILYVPLDNVDAPERVLPEITRQAGLSESATSDPAERLVGYFGERRALLVLDNMEHLIDAGPAIVGLLRASREISVLVTSRVPLRLSGEHVYSIEPFEVPPPQASPEDLQDNPAIMLFIARAMAANARLRLGTRELRVIREICALLDGMPLAIELAAARCGQFRVQELLERFPSALALAADGPRDASDRQRTPRHALEWSCTLLDPAGRRLLYRLSIFNDDWTREAAAQVCRLPGDGPAIDVPRTIDRLVSAALVQRREETGRFGLLQTIREYAAGQLAAAGELEPLRERHARYFLELVEDREGYYVPGLRQAGGLPRIDASYADVRAALGWAAENDPGALVRFASALWPYWHEYGLFREGRAWIAEALSQREHLATRSEAALLTGELMLAYSEADYEAAARAGSVALDRWREIEDVHGEALALLYLGQTDFVTGEVESAGHTLAGSLISWRKLGHPAGIARCQTELAVLLATTGQTTEAMRALQEAQRHYEREGLSEGVARCQIDQGLAMLMALQPDQAIPYLERGIAIARDLDAGTLVAFGLFYLGVSLCFTGQLDEARSALRESLRQRYEARDRYGVAYTLLGFAALARRRGRFRRAARLSGAASRLLERSGIVMNPGMQAIYREEIGAVREALGDEFEAAFEAGKQLRFARAVGEALQR